MKYSFAFAFAFAFAQAHLPGFRLYQTKEKLEMKRLVEQESKGDLRGVRRPKWDITVAKCEKGNVCAPHACINSREVWHI